MGIGLLTCDYIGEVSVCKHNKRLYDHFIQTAEFVIKYSSFLHKFMQKSVEANQIAKFKLNRTVIYVLH